MDVTIYLRDITLDELLAKLDSIRPMILTETIMATLQDLQEQVRKNSDVIGSAVTLIQGFKTRLDEAIAADDPRQVQALSDELGQSTQALAHAVAESTPVAT